MKAANLKDIVKYKFGSDDPDLKTTGYVSYFDNNEGKFNIDIYKDGEFVERHVLNNEVELTQKIKELKQIDI